MCFKAFGVFATEPDQYRGHAIILTSLHPRRSGGVQLLDRILLSPQCASLVQTPACLFTCAEM